MNLIILAAGRGKRMGNMTDNTPKPLIPLPCGGTILEVNIRRAIKSRTFNRITVVTGYLSYRIRNVIMSFNYQITIEARYNKMYPVTGPIYSLSLCRPEIANDNSVVINGDTIYSQQLFDAISIGKYRDGIELFVSKKKIIGKDEMKVAFNKENQSILKVSKWLDSHVVSTGMLVVKGGRYRRLFFETLSHMCVDGHYRTRGYWHEVVNRMSRVVGIRPVFANSARWSEFDTADEYKVFMHNMRDIQ